MSEPKEHPVPDPELLRMLICPVTRSALTQEGQWLASAVGGLRYPVRDGIPVLLADEAKLPADCADLAEFRRRYVK